MTFWFDGSNSQSLGWRCGLRLMVDHNPFYLLSGVFMLLGCYALSVDSHRQLDAMPPLLRLMAVFLVYQATVLGLGLWLSRTRSADMRRDTTHVLLVWIVLTLDATLLYHELFTRSLAAGAAFACVGVCFSLGGLAAIGRLLRLRLSAAAWPLLVADVLLVHGIPGLYRWFSASGFLPDLTEFRAAWLLGLWLAAHALAPDWSRRPGKGSALRWPLLVLPGVSVIAHVYVANWTFSRYGAEAFDLHHLPPLLLGLSAVIARLGRTDEGRRQAKTSAIALGSVAVACSVLVSPPAPGGLEWVWLDRMPILVPGLTITGFAALLLWTWLLHRGVGALLVGYLAVAIGGWLHMPPMIGRTIRTIVTWLRSLIPDDGGDWGVLAIAAAFVTLIAGAAVSLWSQRIHASHQQRL